MRKSVAAVVGTGLFSIGYLLGSAPGLTGLLIAADEKPAAKSGGKKDEGPVNPNLSGLTEETVNKLKAASAALKAAQDALKLEKHYASATKGINVTGVLLGAFDSQADLESGRGVDPETFAALYANMAEDEVARYLAYDPEGRLTYKQRIVRMYPIEKLRRMYAIRAVITGEEIPLTPEEAAAKDREAKASGKSSAKPSVKTDSKPAPKESKEEEK